MEDRGAITYQRSLPCFNTEQMNGLHAISLEEEDSKTEEGGELGSVRVGGCVGGGHSVKCLKLYSQSFIIHTGVNSCDRGAPVIQQHEDMQPCLHFT